MRKALVIAVLSAFVLAVPSAAGARPPALRTSGAMTQQWGGYYYDLGGAPVDCTWRWTASRSSATAPVKGTMTYTVTVQQPDGTRQVLESQSWPVSDVRRLSATSVEIQTIGGHGPTPGWGESPFRIVDGGTTGGDQLLMSCYVHSDFHVIAESGQARIWAR